jgi:hypothetical protein
MQQNDGIKVERCDVATSPTLFKKRHNSSRSKKWSSHSRRGRRSSLGGSIFRGIRNGSELQRRKSSSLSVQSYIFSFWPPTIIEEDDFDCYDDGEEEEDDDNNLEAGCCNACWDKEVAWLELRPRMTSANACKFQAFGIVFCLLGAGTFCLQQVLSIL